MLKTTLFCFAMFCFSCAQEINDPAPSIIIDGGYEDSSSNSFSNNKNCDPQYPPNICDFYLQQNPYPKLILTQYSIKCNDNAIVNHDRCTAFSYNPISEVNIPEDNFAFCCVENDAGKLK